jgi:hypothetical protein
MHALFSLPTVLLTSRRVIDHAQVASCLCR